MCVFSAPKPPPAPKAVPPPPPPPPPPQPVASRLGGTSIGNQDSLGIRNKSSVIASLATGKKRFRNPLQISGAPTGLNVV